MTGRGRWLHAALMAAAATLYLLNNLLLKTAVSPPLDRFFTGYFNDVLAGLFLLAFLNFWLPLWGLRPVTSPWKLALFLLGCGLFWETAPLFYKPGAVCDPWDMAAYLAGGGLYVFFARTWLRRQ